MSGDAEAWLSKLGLCISETVSMRHPRPMEHIARMLVDPSFQESLGLPTAEYVRRHDLNQRITNALGMVGFKAGEAVPADMSSRLSAQLLADAKPRPDVGVVEAPDALDASAAEIEANGPPSLVASVDAITDHLHDHCRGQREERLAQLAAAARDAASHEPTQPAGAAWSASSWLSGVGLESALAGTLLKPLQPSPPPEAQLEFLRALARAADGQVLLRALLL